MKGTAVLVEHLIGCISLRKVQEKNTMNVVKAIAIPIIIALTIWAIQEVMSPRVVLGVLFSLFGIAGLTALAKGLGVKGCLFIIGIGVIVTMIASSCIN